MVAMNFTPTNEPTSPRKHRGNSLDPILEQNGGTGVASDLHGNQSNGVSTKHMNGSSPGSVGALGGPTASQPTDDSLVIDTIANHTSATQGNASAPDFFCKVFRFIKRLSQIN